MGKYLLSILLSCQSAYSQQTVPFSKINPERATYKLFSSYISEAWRKQEYGLLSQGNYSNLIEFKIYELNVSCEKNPLIAFPFDEVVARATDKRVAKDQSWINKNGSRLQVYAISFSLKEFVLIYDGELVDFLGADSQNDCPDLIGVKLINSNLKRFRIIYSSKEKKYL